MSKKTFLLATVLILLVGVLIRGWVVLRNPIPAGDGMASHILLADNLKRGLGFKTFVKWTLYDPSDEFLRPEANRQPAMALLLMPAFALFGTGIVQAQMVVLFHGLLAMFFCAYWAKKLFGREAALVVFGYLAVDPPFVWFSTQPDSLMLYLALFYLILIVADREEISWKRAFVLGAMSGFLYLTRTQGVLAVPAMGVWILLKGGKKKWLKAILCGVTALIIVSPWLIRNMNEFGSPTHSQNGQFLLNENHWSAWSVRETAPSPSDMWNNQGSAAVAKYLGAGILRVIEPFTLGSTHRGEIFGQPTLVLFMVPGMIALLSLKTRRKMLLPLIAIGPVLLALVLHQHAGRYLTIAVPAVVGIGAAGFKETIQRPQGRVLLYWIILICILILAAPFIRVMQTESRARAAEARVVAVWVEENASDSAWVCTYPNVELFHWIYRKPTLAWPNDYEMLLWPYLEKHNVQYMVVDRDLPTLRPWLSRCWRRSPDGTSWDVIDPPPFITEVWRTESDNTIIYEFTGNVPDGYMAVDSLPPDNCRAIGPH
ncbi:MAG: glycosyltransferase family 39 protein [Candidatus Sabulitectum sp.]|nr:glycosyltransferase family 39 protein [Candidatus Sabulitectum sp.]